MSGTATSLRNLLIAALLAALLHMSLLAISFSLNEQASFSQTSLRVSLIEERDTPLERPPEELASPSQPSTFPNEPPEDILVAPPELSSVQEPKIKLQTSFDYHSMQKFVDQETELFRQENPESVNTFNQTFEPNGPTLSNVIGFDSVRERAENRGVGVFASQDKAGNRTCYAEIFDMLDPAAGSLIDGKDCTPKKKFELQMDKPNNGWTER